MRFHFEPISLERRDDYQKKLAFCEPIPSDYTFINLWGWGPEYGLEWAWEDDLVWIRQHNPVTLLWAPIGKWSTVDWRDELPAAAETANGMIRVPEALVRLLGDALDPARIHETRGQWDYLYKRDDLVHLKGNRFHKKKNLVNQFNKAHTSVFLPLGPEMVERASSMQEDWCAWRDCESDDTLAAENKAIQRILKNWKDFQGICGGAIRVGERLVAYTIGETMSDRSLVIHFEKGDPDHKGSYQAINQTFLSTVPEAYEVVNRQQDLDSEGLRKAKLSYNPFDFIRKYRIDL